LATGARPEQLLFLAQTRILRPLAELIGLHVLAGDRAHGDETPVRVLAKHQTRKGRLRVYVRDDKRFAGRAAKGQITFRLGRKRRDSLSEFHLSAASVMLPRHDVDFEGAANPFDFWRATVDEDGHYCFAVAL
jgi:transposase IS66 family protein